MVYFKVYWCSHATNYTNSIQIKQAKNHDIQIPKTHFQMVSYIAWAMQSMSLFIHNSILPRSILHLRLSIRWAAPRSNFKPKVIYQFQNIQSKQIYKTKYGYINMAGITLTRPVVQEWKGRSTKLYSFSRNLTKWWKHLAITNFDCKNITYIRWQVLCQSCNFKMMNKILF